VNLDKGGCHDIEAAFVGVGLNSHIVERATAGISRLQILLRVTPDVVELVPVDCDMTVVTSTLMGGVVS
jgi:hypothetical protein